MLEASIHVYAPVFASIYNIIYKPSYLKPNEKILSSLNFLLCTSFLLFSNTWHPLKMLSVTIFRGPDSKQYTRLC